MNPFLKESLAHIIVVLCVISFFLFFGFVFERGVDAVIDMIVAEIQSRSQP